MTSDHTTEYKQWIFKDPEQHLFRQEEPSRQVRDPLQCDPYQYLPFRGSWYFITKGNYLPIWGCIGVERASKFSINSSNPRELFSFCVAMWAADHEAMRNTIAIGVSMYGTVEVFTIDQTMDQNETTLGYLNANRSVGRPITEQGEDDPFIYYEKGSCDDIKQQYDAQFLHELSQNVVSGKITPANSEFVRRTYLELLAEKALAWKAPMPPAFSAQLINLRINAPENRRQ